MTQLMHPLLGLVAGSLLWLSAAVAAAQNSNMFSNGSFEQSPVFSGWGLSHSYVYPIWMRQYDNFEYPFPVDYDVVSGGTRYRMTFNAADGSTAVNVIGMSLYQMVNLVPGQDYRLSFWIGSYDDGSHDTSGWGSLDVTVFQGNNLAAGLANLLNGGTTIPGGISVDWQRFGNESPGLYHVNWVESTYTFHASSAEAAIFFEGGGFSQSYYSGMDNVALVAVPEPSTIVLIILAVIFSLYHAPSRRLSGGGR